MGAELRDHRGPAWPCLRSGGHTTTSGCRRNTTIEAPPRCDATSSGWTRQRSRRIFKPRSKNPGALHRVPVPDGFGNDDEMVWSLTVNGVTERAYATLRQDYFMDDIIRASEHGAIGAGTTNPTIRANQRPTLRVEGDTTLTVRVGEPLSLVASSSDDGVPESPRKRILVFDPNGLNPWAPHSRVTVNSETGLRVSWFVYRGGGGDNVRPASDQGVGGYPDRRQFALGATLGDAAPAGRWSVGDRGDVRHTGDLCSPLSRQ